MRKIKVSQNGKMFVSRVSTNGAIQNWFKENIGKPAGQCVKSALSGRYGTASSIIHAQAAKCAKAASAGKSYPNKKVKPAQNPLNQVV